MNNSLTTTQKLSIHAALLCVCLAFVFPFIWMVSTSLKPLEQTQEETPTFVPRPMQLENYSEVINHHKMKFPLFTRNTLIIALLCVAGTTLSSA